MIHTAFQAMGTTVDVLSGDTQPPELVQGLFEEFESTLSRFRDDSELSIINASTASSIPVSSTMANVLAVAQDLRERTLGMVDPSVGAAVQAWGYDRTYAEITDIDSPPDPQGRGEWSISGRILSKEPGVMLDLGGVAKGWAADQAVESGSALVVSAGGDVRSGIDDAQVSIVDPWDSCPATVALKSRGLATSSVTRRTWKAGDQQAHHIVNPFSGAPARSPVLSATAMCATGAEAEAAAKAILLHGESGLAWADRQRWVDAAIVVWHDQSVYATQGWEYAA
jgi:thiamine biosynthesis lipoprotein